MRYLFGFVAFDDCRPFGSARHETEQRRRLKRIFFPSFDIKFQITRTLYQIKDGDWRNPLIHMSYRLSFCSVISSSVAKTSLLLHMPPEKTLNNQPQIKFYFKSISAIF